MDSYNRSHFLAHLIHSPPITTAHHTMDGLYLDAKLSIAHTSIAAWNALMRADPIFGRYAMSEVGQSAFLVAFTVVEGGEWRVDGRLHRVGGPALIYPNGHKEWFEHGVLHRTDGPARIYVCGREDWYERGQLHRIGGPAVIDSSGVRLWYERGELHRIGQPAVTYADGYEEWYEYGTPVVKQLA